MKHRHLIFAVVAAAVMLIAACGNQAAQPSVGSSVPSSAPPIQSSVPSSLPTQPGSSSELPVQPSVPGEPAPKPPARLDEYFPFEENVYKKYKGTGNEYAEFESYVDFMIDGSMQIRTINPGTITVSVYRLQDGAVTRVHFAGERYFRLNETAERTGEDILIKEPIEIGTTWKAQDGSTRSITALDVAVDVPAGAYRALEVTTEGNHSVLKDYYAPKIGLVKREFFTQDMPDDRIISALEIIKENAPLVLPIRIFYPDFLNDRTVYVEQATDLYTGNELKLVLEEMLKRIPDGSDFQSVLSPNTEILSIDFDFDTSVVTVDLSSEFLSEMNAGSSFEAMLLSCLVNTFGYNYQTEKVAVTIEGEAYSSGHMYLEKGETWTADYSGIEPYKS